MNPRAGTQGRADEGESGRGDFQALSVAIVHASPGRLRFKVERSEIGGALLQQVERALARLPEVHSVRENPLAGSVVVTYDADALEPEDLLGAARRAGVVLIPVEAGGGGGSPPPSLGESISRFFQQWDERVAEGSRGQVDLRTLVPVALAALGARELLAGRLVAAPWYVLLWYSFDSFLKLRKAKE